MGKFTDLKNQVRTKPVTLQSLVPAVGKVKASESPLQTADYSGDTEQDDKQEQSLILQAMQQGSKKIEQIQGERFWLALVFVTEEQQQAFVKAMNWVLFADPDRQKYFDGVAIAKQMGVELPQVNIRLIPKVTLDRSLVSLGIIGETT